MTITGLKQSMWRGLLGLALMGGVVSTATADFVHNSCNASAQGMPWNYTDIPANPQAGFVIARRAVILNVTYQKTGNGMDELLTGGVWLPFGGFNSTYNTASISGLPGVGIRFTSLRNPRVFFSNQLTLSTATYIGPRENSGRFQDYYLMELIITNARTFKGGTGSQVNGLPVFVVRSNFSHRNPNRTPICSTVQTIQQGEVLTIGGEPLKPIAPPSTPTCTATTQNLNFTVDLPPITPSSLPNIGDMSGGTTSNLVLTECASKASPYVTFTDNNDRSNRTNDLKLSGDSAASGIAIRLMRDNIPIKLGAENTTVNENNFGQFLIGTSNADGSTLTLPLQAYYIRTGKIKPGGLKAGAIITIAYP